MKALDLNAAVVQAVLPWEFSLTVNGQTYATRPLAVADLAAVQALDSKDEASSRAFVAGLFAEPRPDVSGWDAELVGAAAVAVVAYFSEWTKKKSLRLSETVRSLASARAAEAG